jgi:FecR protein
MADFVIRSSSKILRLLAKPLIGDGFKRSLATVFAAIITSILILGFATNANAQEWVIKRVSGVAYFVAPDMEAVRVRKGMEFKKGYTLGTRAGARALVSRGAESISVGPNTTFAISKHRSQNGRTTLLQRKGSIEVDVAKRSRPHFVVETPFMAAVVKGTRFTVAVRSKTANVSVKRGVVEVEDFASGDRADLTAGQNASSAPSKNVGLTVGGKTKPVVKAGSKRPPAFETPKVKNVPTVASANAAQNSATNNSGGVFGGLFGGSSSNGQGNGNSNGNSGDNGNSGGNSNGNSSDNGNSGGNSNGNSSDNGNSNGNSGDNGNGNSNGNSGGNGNSNGNSGGNGNGNSNGNSGGNGNGNSNGNSGGNGNGNGNGNS